MSSSLTRIISRSCLQLCSHHSLSFRDCSMNTSGTRAKQITIMTVLERETDREGEDEEQKDKGSGSETNRARQRRDENVDGEGRGEVE